MKPFPKLAVAAGATLLASPVSAEMLDATTHER